MSSCTGTIFKLHEESAFGGRSGSPGFKSHNLSSTLVRLYSTSIHVPKQWLIWELGFVYYATYNYAASVYFPSFPHVGKCGGEEFAAFTGCATLTSYLFLFLAFYAATYKKASPKQKDSIKAVTKDMPLTAALDLKNTKLPTMSETSETANQTLHAAEGFMKAAGTSVLTTDYAGRN